MVSRAVKRNDRSIICFPARVLHVLNIDSRKHLNFQCTLSDQTKTHKKLARMSIKEHS